MGFRYTAVFRAFRSSVLLAFCVLVSFVTIGAEVFGDDESETQGEPSPGSVAKSLKKSQPHLREFDFWVGEWDVFAVKSGKLAGHNKIEKLRNGHLLVENWQSVKGGMGKSMNFFDRESGQWRQIWVDGGGDLIETTGGIRDGAMHLVGGQYSEDGKSELYRMTFTPKDDGTVFQFIEQSKDAGLTWYVSFHAKYVRRTRPIEFKTETGKKLDGVNRRAFDHWVGDWDATGLGGKFAGRNTIDLLLNANLILENWTGGGGSKGTSFNFFDPGRKKWRQHWVSDGGGLVWYEGDFKDGAMRMTGYNLTPDGRRTEARVKWTSRGSGRVHHIIEHTKDGGETWTQYFDGVYVPHAKR